jgi:hypothetical protein
VGIAGTFVPIVVIYVPMKFILMTYACNITLDTNFLTLWLRYYLKEIHNLIE